MTKATQDLKFLSHRAENIRRKGDNADYQQFLLFQQNFPKALSLELLQVGTARYRINQWSEIWTLEHARTV